MGTKEPWFKFWAADYLTDPDVHILPLEAQAVFVRMLCALNLHGSLPDDNEEIAILTCLKLSQVNGWLPFLLSQKPSHLLSQKPSHLLSQKPSHLLSHPLFELRDGRLISPRMEREKAKSDRARENAQNRANKTTSAESPAKSLANGSAKSPAQKAREPEDTKKDIYSEPGGGVIVVHKTDLNPTPVYDPEDNSDELIEEICTTHPRLNKPNLTRQYIVDEAAKLTAKGISRTDALQKILNQTLVYQQKTEPWPKDQRRYIMASVEFYRSGEWNTPDISTWDRSEGNGSKSDSRSKAQRTQDAIVVANAGAKRLLRMARGQTK